VNAPPTITLTSPASGATFNAPANINLDATASADNATITKVDFYTNGNLIATARNSPYHTTLSSVGAGTYTLTAVATNSRGATTTSNPVTITVNQPSNSQLWSQTWNFQSTIGPSSQTRTDTSVNKEVADDFDLNATIERVVMGG
jgi:hypothetical protein